MSQVSLKDIAGTESSGLVDTILESMWGNTEEEKGAVDHMSHHELVLTLADMYRMYGLLDAGSAELVANEEFRTSFAEDESVLYDYIGHIPEREDPNATYVFIDELVMVTQEQKERLETADGFNRKLVISYSLPEGVLPDSRDVIIVTRGRNSEEIVSEVVSGYIVRVRDESVRMPGRDRIASLIEEYGSAKILTVRVSPDYDFWVAQEAIPAYDVDECIDYILTPWDSSTEDLTCLVSGSMSNNCVEQYRLMRSWKLLRRSDIANCPYIDHIISYNIIDSYGISQGKSTSLYKIRSMLLNLCEARSLGLFVKNRLFNTISELMPKTYREFLPMTVKLFKYDSYVSLSKAVGSSVIIVKPGAEMFGSGMGITVISNEEEYQLAIDKMKALPSEKLENQSKEVQDFLWEDIKKKAVASMYIDNPMLYEGKKYHFRVMYVVTTWGKVYRYGYARCNIAKSAYRNKDYTNKDIHDSHGGSTSRIVFYPNDFPEQERELIRPGLEKTMDRVSVILQGKAWGYQESKYCYEILGVDLMMDTNGICWLIEINRSPGESVHLSHTAEYRYSINRFMRWVHDTVKVPVIESIGSTKLILIEDSSEAQRNQLLELASDRDTMRNIGSGEIWDWNRVELMYKQGKEDSEISPSLREYYDWLLLSKGMVVGYMGLRPTDVVEGALQSRLFVSPLERQKGYGLKMLSMLNGKVRNRRVFSIVKTSNSARIGLALKAGYKLVSDNYMINGYSHHIYERL